MAGSPDDLYAKDVVTLLDLEELDRNLYRGINSAWSLHRNSLYGGQVAAQALMAAGRTVDPDRFPHSLHGYFLRPGQVDRPVILRVDPDRDGGSFSARHVSAIQDGEVIFSMLASFHRGEPENRLDAMPQSDVPEPSACRLHESDPLAENREVTYTEIVDGRQLFSDCFWTRTAAALPDDRLVQACALTYLSDQGSGFGRTGHEIGISGPSLDHAIWFHEPIRADDWVLLHMWPRKSTRARGLYDAAMRDPSGRLGAVVAQENLLRH